MSTSLEKFQNLLRELFQFDCAELDFGIYRIMNHKRDVIERFIAADLPKSVASELERDALATQSRAIDELNECRQRVVQALGSNAIDADGNLLEVHHCIPLGKEYLEHQAKASGAQGRDALEAVIFNHLYAFFSRYYQDGDFISKRRYSKRHRYAIPYNGEEVHLHWANSDQYYVKTGEHFQNYAFKSRRVTVEFRLKAADVKQDNVKSDKRYFVPCNEAPIWDEPSGRLAISLEYRPLTSQEKITYGKTNHQENIINKAVSEIPGRLNHSSEATAALMAERRKNSDGKSVSFFEHHLVQYTRRNTSDFFIHKDLKGFLTRELDFYLKNEVLNLDEMEASGEEKSETWFQTMRTIRSIGGEIIYFLEQIENFQEMLWEKRKFVTETQYCISVRCIDEDFFREIALCDAQWVEWRELFGIDEDQTNLFNSGTNKTNKRVAFLKTHPTLVLDTRHFDQDFVDRLLGSIDDLHGMTDGVLIHSENWQALNLLQARFRGQVQCTYIDPPYNTDASAIVYKNNYKDSSWLSLMENRLSLCLNLQSNEGILCCAIDDEEVCQLRTIMAGLFERTLGIVAVRSNPAGRKSKGQFSPTHEYALFFGNTTSVPGTIHKTQNELARYPHVDKKGRFAWNNLIRHGSNDRRQDRPKMHYPIYVGDDDEIRVPEIRWNSDKSEYDVLEEVGENEIAVWPIRIQGGTVIEKNWHRGFSLVKSDPSEYRVRRTGNARDNNNGINIDFKIRIDMSSMPKTWWDNSKYASANLGAKALKDILGEKEFDFAKSIALVEDCLRASRCDSQSVVLDFFAGSGTTGHAVINLNREDDGKRKFILVEMGDYFDTVLLPRIKKVTFAPEWNGGKPKNTTPQDVQRSPRIVQYMRLESYEDALNNIDFDEGSAQQTLAFQDYLINYMLQWETKRSHTLLNVEKLSKPFSYQLNIHSDGETRQNMADIPETFNYLIGLNVQTRRVHYDDDRRYLVYRGQIDQARVAVIWRETEDWQKPDFVLDRDFVVEQKLTEGVDNVYVNGDSLIHEAKALEPLFKRRMFAGVGE